MKGKCDKQTSYINEYILRDIVCMRVGVGVRVGVRVCVGVRVGVHVGVGVCACMCVGVRTLMCVWVCAHWYVCVVCVYACIPTKLPTS